MSPTQLVNEAGVAARIVVRPYGSALALGLLSLSIGMVLIGGIGLHWIAGPDVATAGLTMAVFVAPLEATAAVFAFLSRDAGAATALGLFSTSWVATGLNHLRSAPGATSSASATFLFAFSVALLAPAIAAATVRPLLAAMLAVSVVRAAVGGIYQVTGTAGWSDAEGIAALLLAAIAMYNGYAFLLEDARQRPVLPTLRRGPSHSAFTDDLAAQLARTTHEAGVRQQL